MSNLSEQQYLVDEAGQVLLDAADYIERHGWCQNQMFDTYGRVCAVGAIQKSSHNTVEAYCRLQIVINRNVENWNDKKGRTKEEVIAALRAAALT